jgi:uncharacterized protein (TIGR02186 family)
MMGGLLKTSLALLWSLVLCTSALAQKELPPESIQIGLSTDTIGIGADFSGANITIFGALTGADPLVQRQGRYDIIVVLEGPEVPLILHRKSRVLGMWMNTDSQRFEQVPLSYIASATRKIQDITDKKTFKQLSLGIEALAFESNRYQALRDAEFSNALKALNRKSGRYSDASGTVEFISPNLFRATLSLPANVPVGKHKARAYLFRNGAFLKESSTGLQIKKAGFEQELVIFSQTNSALYGLGAITIAMLIGWLGRVIFRKD